MYACIQLFWLKIIWVKRTARKFYFRAVTFIFIISVFCWFMYCYERQHSESVPTILFVIAVQLTQHIVSFAITYYSYILTLNEASEYNCLFYFTMFFIYWTALNASSRSSIISSMFSVPIESLIVFGLIPWSASSS